jgi:undecaprenyl-diphosphatase
MPLKFLIARWKNRTSSEVWFLASLLVLCLGVWAFAAVADEVGEQEHQALEEHLMRALRNPANLAEPVGPKWIEQVAIDISALGGATVVILLSMCVGGHLLLRRRWRRVVLLVVTIAGGHLLSHTLKLAYGRERPSVVPHLAEVDSASFPSGHSLSSSVIYLTIGALLAQAAARRREKIYLMGLAFALTFLIGASRVFLGVHYPSDVIAGWIAGTAWALACWMVATRLRGARKGAKPAQE